MIQFSLRQLEYFVAAAQYGGTAQAARMLNVSQPSISQAISALESFWQVQLFHRLHAQGLQLTTEGQQRYPLALSLLRQAEDLSQQDQALSGTIHLGCLSTLGPLYLPGLIKHIQAQHPAIKLHFTEGDNEFLLKQIERNTLDLALLYDTGIFNQVNLHPMTAQRPYIAVAANHPLAQKSSVALADIANEPFILINLPRSRDYFLSLFKLAEVQPNIYIETSSIEMARSLVANEMGVTLLVTRPESTLSYDGKKLVYLTISDVLPLQTIVMATTKSIALSQANSAVLNAAQHYFAAHHNQTTT